APSTPPEPPPGSHAPPPGARGMNVLRWALFAGLLLLAAVSVGSYAVSRWQSGAASGSRKQARYYCPMHPTYTSDRPGECPICGMSLEPIPAGGIDAGSSTGAGDVPGLTSVHITPERVQLIGVRFARVERRPVGSRLDLVGFVAPDESRLKRIQIRVAGWVQELFVSRTGETVATGQPLLTLYSPELYQSEQEYLIEAKAQAERDTSKADPHAAMGHDADGAAAALTRLTLLGVPPEEIARLSRVPVAMPRLTLRSTVNGTVLERNVTQGQYVAADVPLFTIADLSRVWVLADLYEMDYGRVRAGDRATFTSDALPGRELSGRIEFIYPTVSSETRTLKARLSLANPDGALRPGMYGRVRVAGRGGAALTVPTEAVVNTGEHQYVFLAREGGHFEPRMVWTGAQDGDRVQVLRGVAEGDTVVASASFLIDSESRLKAAIEGMGAQPGGEGQGARTTPAPEHRH
ncbi:MAG: efflux RND transporter periplasmic adaptor subunit, partial [Candidatus Eiseniibacteriota bacterium]